MEIQGDVVTHTSDHFDTLYEYAIKFIKEGKAYADDTEQQEVSCLFKGYIFRLINYRCGKNDSTVSLRSTEMTVSKPI